jgi:hypothetical protein
LKFYPGFRRKNGSRGLIKPFELPFLKAVRAFHHFLKLPDLETTMTGSTPDLDIFFHSFPLSNFLVE